MNCREFEDHWNELLDARPTGVTELERALEAHASACEGCRGISARYQVLRQAVAAWSPPPAPSAQSLERLYALTVRSAPLELPRRRSRSSMFAPLATAAALFALAWMGWSGRLSQPLPDDPAPAPVASIASNRPLRTALAEATQATIDLAREASAPAARIGRELLDLDHIKNPVTIENPGDAIALAADPPTSDLLQSVGERVNARVQPISGSARHAFSFLLGPPSGPDPAQVESQGSF